MYKKLFYLGAALTFLASSSLLTAATSTTSSSKSSLPGSAPPASPTTSSTLPSTPATPTAPTRPQETAPKTSKRLEAKHAEPPKVAPGAQLFASPGIVGLRNGQWVGSDDLFNLQRNIEVDIEIVKPEGGTTFLIDSATIKRLVEKMLFDEGLNPRAQPRPEEPPLPLYHVLVLINTINNGFVASCSCRLFEAVTLKRINLQPGITFQAITWEKQDLLILPVEGLSSQIESSVKEMTKEFLGRVRYFQNLQYQIKNQ